MTTENLTTTGYTDAYYGKDNREKYKGEALRLYTLGWEAFVEDFYLDANTIDTNTVEEYLDENNTDY